jgi:hypothetical protein
MKTLIYNCGAGCFLNYKAFFTAIGPSKINLYDKNPSSPNRLEAQPTDP